MRKFPKGRVLRRNTLEQLAKSIIQSRKPEADGTASGFEISGELFFWQCACVGLNRILVRRVVI